MSKSRWLGLGLGLSLALEHYNYFRGARVSTTVVMAALCLFFVALALGIPAVLRKGTRYVL